MALGCSYIRLSGVERIAQRVAHEGQQQQRNHQHAKGGQRNPPGVDAVLALREQLAELSKI